MTSRATRRQVAPLSACDLERCDPGTFSTRTQHFGVDPGGSRYIAMDFRFYETADQGVCTDLVSSADLF